MEICCGDQILAMKIRGKSGKESVPILRTREKREGENMITFWERKSTTTRRRGKEGVGIPEVFAEPRSVAEGGGIQTGISNPSRGKENERSQIAQVSPTVHGERCGTLFGEAVLPEGLTMGRVQFLGLLSNIEEESGETKSPWTRRAGRKKGSASVVERQRGHDQLKKQGKWNLSVGDSRERNFSGAGLRRGLGKKKGGDRACAEFCIGADHRKKKEDLTH